MNQLKIRYDCKLVREGGVPGGHYAIWDGKRKPFVSPMRECNSVPLRHSDVVIDIGAYVGTYAIRCARFPVKKVIAYEPTPRTFDILSLTSLPNLKTIRSAVVGDKRSSVDLFISSGIGVTNSIVLSKRKPSKLRVPAVSYDEAILDASIVKIDVEGAEYGFGEIVRPKLRGIIIDFHPIPGEWKRKANRIISEIMDNGFESIIEPDFSCGWTSAGSWIRSRETFGESEVLMRGERCCGCGILINGKGKSLCQQCFDMWSKKHRMGFFRAEKVDPK